MGSYWLQWQSYNGASLELKNNPKIDFIGKLHLCVDLNANYYTDVNE